ncbi:MAG: hypothetical protein LBI87_00150 [Candidatus Accumulibacter sp.]|jgi:sulfonate transport system permease protein|nr:hypothetical protein [Accumulibacter sp.]
MQEKTARLLGGLALYAALPVFLVAVWKGADLLEKIKPYTLPAPERVLKTAVDFMLDGSLPDHIAASAARVGEGFLIALVLALILGIDVGLSRKLEIVTDLSVQILKPIPPIA